MSLLSLVTTTREGSQGFAELSRNGDRPCATDPILASGATLTRAECRCGMQKLRQFLIALMLCQYGAGVVDRGTIFDVSRVISLILCKICSFSAQFIKTQYHY